MARRTFGSRCALHRKTRSHQDKPNPEALACAQLSSPSTSIACATNALGMRQRLRRRSGISPLYDVKNSAAPCRAAETVLSVSMDGTDDLRMDSWWSQTGSNRRPQACKASALPTELWPRNRTAHSIAAEIAIHPRPITTDVVGLGRFELPTSRLSSARSNQLSYRPEAVHPCEERETKTAVSRASISSGSSRSSVCIVQVRARTAGVRSEPLSAHP